MIDILLLLFFLTVGHLSREVSQVTKFILDRGAKLTAALTSTNFRLSLLVQESLEIARKVTEKIPAKIKKPHDFGSIQSVGKRLLHGTYRRGNLGSFLAIVFHDSPLRTQKSPPFQRKKIEIEKLKKRKNGVKSRNKRTRH